MKKISHVLFLGFAALLLTNCSDSDHSTEVQRFDFENKEQAQNFLTDFSISCEKLGECSEASGGLAFTEEKKDSWGFINYSGGVCSQTLIAPNKILTNRHCLPDNALFKNSNCKNITVFFPATVNKSSEKINCKSVVDLSTKYSGTDSVRPDWAILELEKNPNRKPVQVDSSGIPHDSTLVAYPVYYSKTDIVSRGFGKATFSVRGLIRKISCSSKMNSVFSYYYKHPLSPLFSLICNKNVISGNSGSGVYGANGNLVGVISMAAKKDSLYEGMGKTRILDNTFAGGTNAHCIGPINQQQSEACLFESSTEKMYLGFVLSLVFAQEPNLSEKERYESVLSRDSHIQWEDYNSQFMDQILKQDIAETIKRYMGGVVTDFIVLRESQTRFPQTPKCISSVKKVHKDFHFYMPSFYSQYSDTEILPSSLMQSPLKSQNLVFKARYDKNLDVFKAQLLRLDSSKQKQFKKILEGISDDASVCLSSGFSFDCSRLNRLEQEKASYYGLEEMESALYFNEDFISGNSFGTREVSIPVCE